MDLYLIRHAPAFERDPERWSDDATRPLTPEGEEAFRLAALGLTRLANPPDALLSSPFERAWRTAGLLGELDGWPAPKPLASLEPTLPPQSAAAELAVYAAAGTVAMVGHRPCLHELAAYLLTGRAEGAGITIKKGGVFCMRFDGPVEPGAGQLRWLATPKILRLLALRVESL